LLALFKNLSLESFDVQALPGPCDHPKALLHTIKIGFLNTRFVNDAKTPPMPLKDDRTLFSLRKHLVHLATGFNANHVLSYHNRISS